MLGLNNVYLGDCLEVMKEIDDKSIDMILCDLPYGITAAKWDSEIDLELLWKEYKRVVIERGAVVLFAAQPFTSKLVCSNISNFKYSWVWEKSKASNFLLARKQPLRAHEDILVFCDQSPRYFPQKTKGKPYKGEGRSKKGSNTVLVNSVPNPTYRNDNKGDRFPRSVQYFKTAESEGCYHPTQKPLELCEYFIKTYTNEGDLVLDNCCGSGTTGIAAINLNRNFILIEKDAEYYKVASNRLLEHMTKGNNNNA